MWGQAPPPVQRSKAPLKNQRTVYSSNSGSCGDRRPRLSSGAKLRSRTSEPSTPATPAHVGTGAPACPAEQSSAQEPANRRLQRLRLMWGQAPPPVQRSKAPLKNQRTVYSSNSGSCGDRRPRLSSGAKLRSRTSEPSTPATPAHVGTGAPACPAEQSSAQEPANRLLQQLRLMWGQAPPPVQRSKAPLRNQRTVDSSDSGSCGDRRPRLSSGAKLRSGTSEPSTPTTPAHVGTGASPVQRSKAPLRNQRTVDSSDSG